MQSNREDNRKNNREFPDKHAKGLTNISYSSYRALIATPSHEWTKDMNTVYKKIYDSKRYMEFIFGKGGFFEKDIDKINVYRYFTIRKRVSIVINSLMYGQYVKGKSIDILTANLIDMYFHENNIDYDKLLYEDMCALSHLSIMVDNIRNGKHYEANEVLSEYITIKSKSIINEIHVNNVSKKL